MLELQNKRLKSFLPVKISEELRISSSKIKSRPSILPSNTGILLAEVSRPPPKRISTFCIMTKLNAATTDKQLMAFCLETFIKQIMYKPQAGELNFNECVSMFIDIMNIKILNFRILLNGKLLNSINNKKRS
jgi:hypothetical protein